MSSSSEKTAARLPLSSVALVSALALAYEVLLMRLFSIVQWHHFAYMVISLALLGFGASGALLSVFRERLLARFELVFVANIVIFALSTTVCFSMAQRVGFHPEQMLWDPARFVDLAGVYLMLAVPFFCAANVIGLAFSRYGDHAPRIYSADLLGAGSGSAGIVFLLYVLHPVQILQLILALGLVAAGVAWLHQRIRPRAGAVLALALAPVAFLLPDQWTAVHVSPYKPISQTLQIADTEIIASRSSPLGLIDVAESRTVPFRHAPGLSLNAVSGPPEQLAIFIDGDAMTPVQRYDGDRTQLRYLDYLSSALPYHLRSPQDVLVLGSGGGAQVLQALYHGVPQIDAVELDPGIVELVRKDFGEYAGGLYELPSVRVHIEDARGFLAGTDKLFGLIQLEVAGSFGASAAGLYAVNVSYLYTVEAVRRYLKHLRPGGYLAITQWANVPPRGSLKSFATALEALRQLELPEPERRLVMIRGWQTSTLLIKNGVFTDAEIGALKSFNQQRSFDVVYYPGVSTAEVNRYNQLDHPWFHQGATALLSDNASEFIDQYKFDLHPPTDEQPYFANFFKWSTLPEIVGTRGRGGLVLLESGYLVLVATLLQASAAGLILIVAPLLIISRRKSRSRGGWTRVLVYFGVLGLGFLFVEIAFIHKITLFMHHPIQAVALVLTTFLVFAGLGSRAAQRFGGEAVAEKGARKVMVVIAGLVLVYALVLGPLLRALIGAPLGVRVAVAILVMAPLAFCMGMPFPLGLRRVAHVAPALIPWAWGINGCLSVVSAVLATLLAVHFGFTFLLGAAVLLYGAAALSFPR